VIFLLAGKFDPVRLIVIILFFAIFLIDGFADVFMGDLQQKGKMRIAGRMRVCAFGFSFIMFTASMVYTQTIIAPLILSCIALFAVYAVWIWCYRKHFIKVRIKCDAVAVKKLARNVMPLFFGAFVFSYLLNMQKYYLGFLSTDESVAIITMLILPGTALYVLSLSLFGGAEMTKTALKYNSGNIKELSQRINRQILFAFVLSVIFMICVYVFGMPLLSLIFSTDLSSYTIEFIIIASGGALYTVFAVLYSAIVVLRAQKTFLYCIVIVAFITGPIMWLIVTRYGITGAAFTNLAVLLPLTVAFFAICRSTLGKLSKGK